MKSSRIRQMEEYIRGHEYATLEELCVAFGKSINTIRRDVSEIVKGSEFQKVYGGVQVVKKEHKPLVSYQERDRKNPEEKAAIGAVAAAQIQNGDVVFLDSGTTTVGILANLETDMPITVLTNNCYVILECLQRRNINLIVLGGQLNPDTASLSANFCRLDHLERFNINKAFLAATGVSIQRGATNTSPEETVIKQAVVERCNRCYLLADHSKFGQSALLTYARLEQFHSIITDREPDEEYRRFFAAHNIAAMW